MTIQYDHRAPNGPAIDRRHLWRWEHMAQQLARNPDIELTPEEFSTIDEASQAALKAGAPFDLGFVAIMDILRRQIVDGSEDSDYDVDVADFENEDPDEDGQAVGPHSAIEMYCILRHDAHPGEGTVERGRAA